MWKLPSNLSKEDKGLEPQSKSQSTLENCEEDGVEKGSHDNGEMPCERAWAEREYQKCCQRVLGTLLLADHTAAARWSMVWSNAPSSHMLPLQQDIKYCHHRFYGRIMVMPIVLAPETADFLQCG